MGNDLLEIGKSGLYSSRKSLQTAGHNIANINTEGYSRQRVTQAAYPPEGNDSLVMGTGSYIKSIGRVHNEHIEKSLSNIISENSFNQNRFESLSELEQIFNEISTQGLNQTMAKFLNSFRELANQPESETVRSMVRENGKILITDIKRAHQSLQEFSKRTDHLSDEVVKDINSALTEVANLNIKVSEIEGFNGESGDLRDQRDTIIRRLSEYFNVHTYVDDKGKFAVSAKGIGTLVSGDILRTFKSAATQEENPFRASHDIFFDNSPNNPLSMKFVNGKLGSLFETRNNEIKFMKDKLDELAWQIGHSVNALHRRGYTNNDPSSNKKITGIDFFHLDGNKKNAASTIDLSNDVKEELSNIVSALGPLSPGDNRIALAISKLQNERISGDGTKTFEENYLEAVGSIGLATGKARINLDQTESMLAQTKSIRERVSGVSIDEETANIAKLQQAYEASARVIRIADEMFKTVLSIKP